MAHAFIPSVQESQAHELDDQETNIVYTESSGRPGLHSESLSL